MEGSEENSANLSRGPHTKADYQRSPVTPKNLSASVPIPTMLLLGAKSLWEVWEEHKRGDGIQSPAAGGPQQFYPCMHRSKTYILTAAPTPRSFFSFI